MYAYLIAHPALAGAALVAFVLVVAAVAEYVLVNGSRVHHLVAVAAGLPLVPLLPHYGTWLPGTMSPFTWLVAGFAGYVAVNACQLALVVPLDRVLDEWHYRRSLRPVPVPPASAAVPVGAGLPVGAGVAAASYLPADASVTDPDYFWSVVEAKEAEPVVALGDPLAQVSWARIRNVA